MGVTEGVALPSYRIGMARGKLIFIYSMRLLNFSLIFVGNSQILFQICNASIGSYSYKSDLLGFIMLAPELLKSKLPRETSAKF